MSLLDLISHKDIENAIVAAQGSRQPVQAGARAIADLILKAESRLDLAEQYDIPVAVLDAFAKADLPITEIARGTSYRFIWEINVRVVFGDDFRESEPLVYLVQGAHGGWLLANDRYDVPNDKLEALSQALGKIKDHG
ncbi:hypothetical protein HOU02_gp259 [Caulobacter phage CcrBL9]|uniref:Uncharacterized protein n=1 Tax=Caulobacter phage CcrBL9 TaxID=2283270 RepID=A0A385ECQ6_9CAUD|nr:hypothetical protein HOU02_gp259 [Caulobacter phage CcrBL9]AXQ69466.1 hypothetical protein CcrBL9_gp442 [Caulobacter phage CcrBL9]